MKWEKIRNLAPNSCVLIEAITAYSQDNKRIIKEMSLLEKYSNEKEAWSGYKQFHREHPEKELYILHTGNKDIEIEESVSHKHWN
ncbi:hypothetical protein [Priestia megaterium]|uniref:Uncharacterized protein n=1 Tax=Priestia megaterium TaxID=1404 RepID=A0A6M6E403_PRIMG|nr:hypothetical protein [Priestia megaterium]QJX80344.1 hypothetical protein FDZ14_30110 [Priestia megaterium]